MNIQLKNCPFCGSEAHATHRINKGHRVECTERHNKEVCPVNMRTHHFNTKEDAAEAWNNRYE